MNNLVNLPRALSGAQKRTKWTNFSSFQLIFTQNGLIAPS